MVVTTGVLERRIRVAAVVRQLKGTDPHDPFDGVQRHCEQLIAGAHHQGPVDGDGKGYAQFETCALTRGGRQVNDAAEALEFAGNHVQTNASTRNFGDFSRS